MASLTVGIRLFKETDLETEWDSVPVIGFMPVFLSGDHNVENINKRVYMLYLRNQSTYTKARWHYKENEAEGFWVES